MGATPAGNGTQSKWFSIREGLLVETFKTPQEGAKERLNKKNALVYEFFYKDVTGVIVEIEKRSHEFGEDLQVKLKDEEGYYNIQMPFSSRYAASLLMALENTAKGNPLTLRPYHFKDQANKTVAGIALTQYGNKVAKKYTKETPHGIPSMVQIKVKGVMQWDSSQRDEWLYNKALDFMKSAEVFSQPPVQDAEDFNEEIPF